MKNPITREQLVAFLSYDPQSGAFLWVKHREQRYVGRVAGTRATVGYWQIALFNRRFLAHRLAFLYMTGEWPAGVVDHMNGDPLDNRWANLRAVSPTVNQQNMRAPHRDSSTGFLGVKRHGRTGFQAQIQIEGRSVPLGTFRTPEEAHAAYVAAKRQHHEGCTI